jgi:hypothetical protein
MATTTKRYTLPKLSEESKKNLEKVLDRAAEDIEFRERLLSSPAAALKDSGLSKEEIKGVSDLRRVGLEEWGINVRKFRTIMRDNGNSVRGLELAILARSTGKRAKR